MNLVWAVLAVGFSAAALYWWYQRRRDGPATLVLAPELMPKGNAKITGDVVLRAQARATGQHAEIDVPTSEVDRILGALQGAGFAVHDTGMTVDTDEGEETLTTIAMDMDGQAMPAGHPDDILSISGDLTVEAGIHVACHLHVGGDATLHDSAVVAGDLLAGGSVHLGSGSTVRGILRSRRDIHLGPGSVARAVFAQGDVHVADTRADADQRIKARRVLVAETR